MSKNISQLIRRYQPKTFKIFYAPEYKTFTVQHIATDTSHPLHIAQNRRLVERRKEGLWWHVTTSIDLSKSSCVRTWARRRLRDAVRHELTQRGYDETGSLVNAAAVNNRPELLAVLRRGGSLDLKGSLRLHVLAPLIPAKYTVLCTEMGQLIDDMMQQFENKKSGYASERKVNKPKQGVSFITKPQPPREKGGYTSKDRSLTMKPRSNT
ncbi:hypothetical protein T440DRAFT_400359 [Plenodomus tracheiphilus IPT5]|uniref:Uncharacterized protein n=1 Tax=Plenodomus tracheiphilus IPT5 TaxID=1408161 RepID=A0A6A7B2H9_9PLEO|nr:hypothetical protein T440DRAFT_400359 [Plenodomus tracheiphilus IPT5]